MKDMTTEELIEFVATSKAQNYKARRLGLREVVTSTARATKAAKHELAARGVTVR